MRRAGLGLVYVLGVALLVVVVALLWGAFAAGGLAVLCGIGVILGSMVGGDRRREAARAARR